MQEYINKQDRVELSFIYGHLKVAGELFRPNYGRSIKSGPKFDISNCNISGTTIPIFKK